MKDALSVEAGKMFMVLLVLLEAELLATVKVTV